MRATQFALQLHNAVHLHLRAFRQCRNSKRRARRIGFAKILAHHFVDELKVRQIDEKYIELRDLRKIAAGGLPIILFVEQQTTGGYAKMANVISADLHSLGQLRPRDEIRFELVRLATARKLLIEQEKLLACEDLMEVSPESKMPP